MKLSELHEDQQLDMPSAMTPQMQAAVKLRNQDPTLTRLGNGASAIVVQSKSPHQMDNVERLSSGEDGTSAYLQAIANVPAVHDNPFLPKVRSVRRAEGVMSVVAERLHPYDSKKLFTQPLIQAVWEQITSEPFPTDPAEQMVCIDALIETSIFKGVNKYVHNEQFKQAIEFIRAVRKRFGGYPDIHEGNLMWRMTGTMPQLVITDPLS